VLQGVNALLDSRRGRFGLGAVPHEQAKNSDVLFVYQYGTVPMFIFLYFQ
jgi:hypothetical protein